MRLGFVKGKVEVEVYCVKIKFTLPNSLVLKVPLISTAILAGWQQEVKNPNSLCMAWSMGNAGNK